MAEEKKEKVPSAKKRAKQNEKARLRNRSFKTRVKTALRSFEESSAKKETLTAQKALNTVFSLMDKGVKIGCYKLNKASRTKARLSKKIPKATT
jgi:small subunit ribosomal protein S20